MILTILTGVCLHAQLNATLIGDAVNQGNNCYTITQDLEFQAGGVWFDNPIDFDESFTIYYQNDFGSKDIDGADGMALVFKGTSNPELGAAGGGVGYQGIAPSLVVEFDTYQNNIPSEGLLEDPTFDHIAILRNGDPFHGSSTNNLAGPVQASANSENIEDGIPHDIKIVWRAPEQILEVYFDCELRISLNLDIKSLIFNGDESIFFGFVGSTGGLSNIHEVCFNSISFVDNLQLQDRNVCEGETVIVDATIPSGVSYSWSPTEGVSDPNSSNPFFNPSTTTTYSVTIEDVCGETTVEDITLTVLPVVTPQFDPVDDICLGESLDPLPTISNNGISGIWTPELNNTNTTTYTFIPDADQCAPTTTLEIVVNPLIIPFFDPIDSICEGEFLEELPTLSTNGITGTWAPEIDNSQTTLYTFTPDPDQECTTLATLEIEVEPLLTPIFDDIDPVCAGTDSPLPEVSNNGISGSWFPAYNSMETTTYSFIADAPQCAQEISIEVVVVPNTLPLFDSIDPVCEGQVGSPLPTTSINGVSGSWSPSFNNSETTIYSFTPEPGECAEVVTMEVEIIPLVVPEFSPVDPICPGDELMDLPTLSTNGISGVWSPAIDNTQTTIYTFTPLSGQGCVTTTTLEIVVIDPVIPVFDEYQPICAGSELDPLPSVSNNGVTGFWFPEVDNMQTTTYTFTPDPGQCTNVQVELTIEVIPFSVLTISTELISEPFSSNQSVQVNVVGGTGNYEYSLNGSAWQESNIFENIRGCDENIARAREVNTCSNVATTEFRVFDYPRFFTPNGDANNDFWNIKCLDNQQASVVSIYDRYGKFLTRFSTTGRGWDGTYNGDQLPANDYWFTVNYLDVNGNPKVLSSHFSLKR